MAQKTKKQHYVPQFYLNAWSATEKHQIFVYDKESETNRINNIRDVASEKYFYDFNIDNLFSAEFIESLRKLGIPCSKDDRPQIIEQAFAETVEKPFSDLLKAILENTSKLTPWHVNNCYFISEEQKDELSAYLAIQFIRLKRVRSGILDSADCLAQAINDMGFPNSESGEYALSKEQAKKIHIQMLLDPENLARITDCFHRLTWMLGINKTKDKLYTSDNPIGTWAHIKDPIMSMNGIGSKGVEAFFPLSPDVILIMVDGSFHTSWIPFDRRYIEITDSANIDYYNSIIAMEAERFIYSSDGNITLLEEMKRQTPDVFKHPHVQLSWGGKTYYPTQK